MTTLDTLNLTYYSPTGTTQKIIREIGKNLRYKLISENNIAEKSLELTAKNTDNSLTIIGLPVYGGRIPLTAIESLKNMQSNQSPAVILVVYGNREYDDALLELKEIVQNCGFNIIAGAAFIGEHSYSTNEKPIAQNRPDTQDLEKCRDFAKLISKKLKKNKVSELQIPGNYPYKERRQFSKDIHPETMYEQCNLCGICVDSCPTNAISIEEETVITNGALCTLCCACVKNCPSEARLFENSTVNTFRENLLLNCSLRKEPVYFL